VAIPALEVSSRAMTVADSGSRRTDTAAAAISTATAGVSENPGRCAASSPPAAPRNKAGKVGPPRKLPSEMHQAAPLNSSSHARVDRAFASAPRSDQPQGRSGLCPETTVPVVESPTKRELEVLRHASGMLNTAEIASEMCISINTVKAHLKSSYRKLAATHRGEAVRRAQQLELI
jgi:DNA-binding CsgD family transcriptional regulator